MINSYPDASGVVTNRVFRQTTPGTYTFTPTISGLYEIEFGGGGAAGGGVTSGATGNRVGGGVGMITTIRTELIAGTGYSYTVGAGGVGTNASTPVPGANSTFTGVGGVVFTALGAIGQTGGRLDGITTDAANAAQELTTIYGANGGGSTIAGGRCAPFAGGAAGLGGGGGSSKYARGGAGGGTNQAGFAGALCSGGGGASGNVAPSPLNGGNGGNGFFQASWIGVA